MSSVERRRKAGRHFSVGSRLAALILVALAFGAQPVAAADDQPAPLSSKTEIRVGGLVHDVPFTGPGREFASADLNVEIDLPRLPLLQDTWFRSMVPRPQIGGTANFSGKTSYVYVDGAWNWRLSRHWFIEPMAGVGFHNGKLDVSKYSGRLSLGCNPLFHIGASAGYRLTDHWSVMATWEHLSNADICRRNEGLNEAGVKISRNF